MASEIIGRAACPECGFHAAHIKIKTDKEGAHPYRHCPDCGAQYFTRTKNQAANLRKMIKAGSETQTTPTATQTEIHPRESEAGMPAGAAEETTPPPSPQNYKIVFGVRVPV